MNVNKLFLFGLSQMGGLHGKRHGIIEGHAYSIMEVRELDDFRLLKIRYASPSSQCQTVHSRAESRYQLSGAVPSSSISKR